MSGTLCRGAGCLSGVGSYLLGTVLQECRLFKQCAKLPARHWGAVCLSSVRTYLPGTVLQGCRLFKQCQNLPTGHCVQGYRLFKPCWNLPAGHCVAGGKAVSTISEPTCQALCCRCAGCLNGVRAYLPCTVLQGCRLF